MTGETGEAETRSPRAGRNPSQRRSRERVERILEVATELIAEAGSDALKMSEVAVRAGISIGSLYQYFPDKAAIIHALAERYNENSRHCIEDALNGVHTREGLIAAFDQLVETYYALFLEEPVMRDIWSGTQADKALADLEMCESGKNAAIVAAAILRANPKAEEQDAQSRARLIMHLGEAAMRLAIALDRKEGRFIVTAYKQMALRELETVLK